ncbi:histidine kinase [Agromyces sp. SYSU K20354]|uniref:sensor histidine kinase n=1 Tax=Agromyces cavernae TaxID=2898659 RepID=UPI001E2D8D67|nr:histidine kinase [Agromyces cavernae]MCD2441184.1 histidine kinase [Agromyces cavernae]
MNESAVVPVVRRIPAWAWDLVAGVLVIAAALLPSVGRGGDHGPEAIAFSPWTIAIAIAAALVLPFRRRWPIPVLGAAIALLVVGTLVVGSAFPFVLPVAIAAFGVANRLERRRSVPIVALAIALLIGIELLAGPPQGFDARLVPVPALVGFAAAAGDATRSRRAYIKAITERAERAERTKEAEARRRVAEERLRIARDLHDAVAHQIAVINLHSGVASRAIATDHEPDLPAARTSLTTISGAARAVLSEIGDLLSVLRGDPAVGSDVTPTAPQSGLGGLDELLAGFGASGLDTTVRVEGAPRDIPPAVDRVAYQVIREGLTNAHKHGAVPRAHLLLVYGDDEVDITITNPVGPEGGPGSPASTGLGLIGIRERVAAVRGTVRTDVAGSVHRLVAVLPLRREEHT